MDPLSILYSLLDGWVELCCIEIAQLRDNYLSLSSFLLRDAPDEMEGFTASQKSERMVDRKNSC